MCVKSCCDQFIESEEALVILSYIIIKSKTLGNTNLEKEKKKKNKLKMKLKNKIYRDLGKKFETSYTVLCCTNEGVALPSGGVMCGHLH